MQPIGASVLAVTCVHRVCTARAPLMPLGATWQMTVPFLTVGGGGRHGQTAANSGLRPQYHGAFVLDVDGNTWRRYVIAFGFTWMKVVV